jgi:legumain
MKAVVLCAIALCVAIATASMSSNSVGTNWALVIAGSNGYYNYRHQADVCHAYQVLHAHGIPDSNIIVMMYDDIANNDENPVKGNIINKPNGSNVYPGVLKDYTGETVTAQNFLNVLSGNAAAMKGIGSGRVINSGPNDNVFVFFSDHGGPGLIAMPTGPYLYAKDLVTTLKSMASGKKFHQLVFYLEACESGSMFDGLLPNNINIFATTASNPDESSYACYWDDTRQAYLGDLYSVSWMESSDVADFKTETLQQQFVTVQNETNTSHVCEYGQQAMSSELIANFQGFQKFAHTFRRHRSSPVPAEERLKDAVDSRDVVLATLLKRLSSATSPADRSRLMEAVETEVLHRRTADERITTVAAKLVGHERASEVVAARRSVDHECVPSMVSAYEQHCGRFSDYTLKHAHVLNNLCHEGVSAKELASVAAQVC